MTPDEFTISEQQLAVGDGHELYICEWGNKAADKTIIFLVGGPGGYSKDRHKISFDPSTQHVIFFDQRGCGKSTPYGSLEHNTTQDLVEDISKIAEAFSLETFVLVGGSWGSCLALAYGVAHPDRVSAMVLNGIFTGSSSEINWLDKGLFQTHFPDAWDHYLAATPAEYRDAPTAYHFERAIGADMAAAAASAKAYGDLEGAVMRLDDRFSPYATDNLELESMRTEIHYMKNGCFLTDRYILDNAHKLTMPIHLIQGRYDMVCPPQTAHELSKSLPKGKIYWTIAGHAPEHETINMNRTLIAQVA